MTGIGALLSVPSTDPDDARRRRLLNILLVGIVVLVLVGLLVTLVASSLFGATLEEMALVYAGGLAALIGNVIIYLVNRYWSGGLASVLFLLLLTAVMAFSDEPQQVVEGRSLFLFAIPIMVASVLLRSWASFLVAGVCGLTVVAILCACLKSRSRPYAQFNPLACAAPAFYDRGCPF